MPSTPSGLILEGMTEDTVSDEIRNISQRAGTESISRDRKQEEADLSVDRKKPRYESPYQSSTTLLTSLTRTSPISDTRFLSLSESGQTSASKFRTKTASIYNSDRREFESNTKHYTDNTRISSNFNNAEVSNVLDFDPVLVSSETNDTIAMFEQSVKGQTDDSLRPVRQDDSITCQQIHKTRIQRLEKACGNKELFANKMFKDQLQTIMYKSQRYDFAYCKVPKVGSTFLTKVFGVLKYGLRYGERFFLTPRAKVHSSMYLFSASVNSVIKNKSRTVLVARDPYSRLFSAYIDKSYLLLIQELNNRIHSKSIHEMYNTTSCPTNVSFQEFLDWIITRSKTKPMNRHWAPISSLCRPCEVNAFILVKQETFARDVEFALKELRVERDKYDYITLALHDHRAELSLPGIIETLMNIVAKSETVERCLGYEKYVQRIWRSFQIQGYISEKNEFPVEKFNKEQFSNKTFIAEIVLQTLHDDPVTSTQSKTQRQKFLYQAYRSVKPEILREIQELYKQDFELFGYNKLPPREITTHENR